MTENSPRHYLLPVIILAVMFALELGSSWNDSAIFDETAHIPAGYSYLTQFDYRLNPEHPPLIKDLAALPLLFFKHLNFPTNTKAWADEINGEWDQGHTFLYTAGNNPDQILFWMRLPIMLLTLALGWLLYSWTRRRFGNGTALLTLIFYAFSPTVIAHSRFVTTDIGAMFAFFISLITFLRMLEQPNWRRVIYAGIAFGLAQSIKYSLFLLVPFYFLVILIWTAAKRELSPPERVKFFFELFAKYLALGLVSVLIIWVIFLPHVWNYPLEKNFNDATHIIGGFRLKALLSFDLFLLSHKWSQPLGQYLYGLMMITQRQLGGNTEYFLGQISSKGTPLYFPLLYLLKEPIGYHLLGLIALVFGLQKVFKPSNRRWNGLWPRVSRWMHSYPVEFLFGFFVLFYWTYSVFQPLNIGLRHVLPTYPPLFLLISKELVGWLRGDILPAATTWWQAFKNLFKTLVAPVPKYLTLAVLLFWSIISVIAAFPFYLSYFNAFGGGVANGYKIATDSNYDWGQDLRRLRDFMNQNGIQKIAVDYFGGGDPSYYLGEKFEPWWSSRGIYHGWLAVSANTLMTAYGRIGPGFERKREDSYEWLKPFRPVARAGTSIFIYRLP